MISDIVHSLRRGLSPCTSSDRPNGCSDRRADPGRAYLDAAAGTGTRRSDPRQPRRGPGRPDRDVAAATDDPDQEKAREAHYPLFKIKFKRGEELPTHYYMHTR